VIYRPEAHDARISRDLLTSDSSPAPFLSPRSNRQEEVTFGLFLFLLTSHCAPPARVAVVTSNDTRTFLPPSAPRVCSTPECLIFGSNRQATALLGSRGVLKWRFNSLVQRPSSICITKENICQRPVCRLLVLHVLWFVYEYSRV